MLLTDNYPFCRTWRICTYETLNKSQSVPPYIYRYVCGRQGPGHWVPLSLRTPTWQRLVQFRRLGWFAVETHSSHVHLDKRTSPQLTSSQPDLVSCVNNFYWIFTTIL